jgi:hypothetical protein
MFTEIISRTRHIVVSANPNVKKHRQLETNIQRIFLIPIYVYVLIQHAVIAISRHQISNSAIAWIFNKNCGPLLVHSIHIGISIQYGNKIVSYFMFSLTWDMTMTDSHWTKIKLICIWKEVAVLFLSNCKLQCPSTAWNRTEGQENINTSTNTNTINCHLSRRPTRRWDLGRGYATGVILVVKELGFLNVRSVHSGSPHGTDCTM